MKVLAVILLFAVIAAAHALPYWGGYGYGGYGYGAKVVGPGFGIYKSYAYPAYRGYGWGGYGGKGLYW